MKRFWQEFSAGPLSALFTGRLFPSALQNTARDRPGVADLHPGGRGPEALGGRPKVIQRRAGVAMVMLGAVVIQ